MNISSADVTVKSLKTNYQNDGDVPTLNVSVNFTVSNFLEMGQQSGGVLNVLNGGNVLLFYPISKELNYQIGDELAKRRKARAG